jgi:preprotein translocase subunit SecG
MPEWIPVVWDRLILILGIFLILLVLIQRGKGGGLAGAFGGAGGSSAFGSRAGDTFTRITIGVASVWIVMIILQVWFIRWSKPEGGAAASFGGTPASQTK